MRRFNASIWHDDAFDIATLASLVAEEPGSGAESTNHVRSLVDVEQKNDSRGAENATRTTYAHPCRTDTLEGLVDDGLYRVRSSVAIATKPYLVQVVREKPSDTIRGYRHGCFRGSRSSLVTSILWKTSLHLRTNRANEFQAGC